MDFKKFRKFTNSDKISKIDYYGVDKYYDYLKIINVLNYFTVEVVIYNRDKLNKWIFKLDNVDVLDNKLSSQNKDYLKKRLKYFVLDKYMRFEVNDFTLNTINGTIFFDNKLIGSVNTSMINITINLSVLKEKIKMIELKEREGEKAFIKKFAINKKSKQRLPTIYEEEETSFA